MSERKKYTIIATQPTLYRKEFHAHSQIKALKLAEESHPEEWEVIEREDWEYKITEDK
tara:strand:+ start:138 stop:311 length:174 start_codon:yes stop_codon:yes gene_type:complete